jgi:hypothetical protein
LENSGTTPSLSAPDNVVLTFREFSKRESSAAILSRGVREIRCLRANGELLEYATRLKSGALDELFHQPRGAQILEIDEPLGGRQGRMQLAGFRHDLQHLS